jgi:peptidyl-prolyl cis-trans isomerase C
MGLTPEKFHAQLHEQALIRTVIERELVPRIMISQESVEKFYQENLAAFQEPEMVRLTHLLLSRNDSSGAFLSPDEQDAKQQKAREILDQVRNGADFRRLAQDLSEDHLARARGSEYLFTRAADDPRRATLPEIERVAFALQPGQISEVITSRIGYHLVQVEERIPARTESLEQAEPAIRRALIEEELVRRINTYTEELRQEAGVEILWADYVKPPRPALSP